MGNGPAPRDEVLQDFLTWLNQNNPGGDQWYLDEGPVPVEAAPAEPATADPVSVPVEAPPAVATPRPGPAADPDPAFAAECRTFVTETLDLIHRQPAAPFSAPATDPVATLSVLREKVLPCTACDLAEGRNSTVFGAGHPAADLMFIGEAPGRDEDLQGEPFVGASGQLLTKILGAIGFAREDVFIANILKCRPPNNRDPLPVEVAACEGWLNQQLEIIRPRVICCLGRVAAQTLLKTDASLGSLRKSVNFYAGVPVMATYHPAALLRNPNWKRDTWNDVQKLRALYDALLAEGE